MVYLILVKHAMPEIVRDRPAREWVLSAEGRTRCLDLARVLSAYEPEQVITSDEPKAVETGQIVAQRLKLTSEIRPGLHEHERHNEPYYDNRDTFEARARRFFEQPSDLVFGLETADAAYRRFAGAIHAINPQKTTVIVSHGTVISLFVARHNTLDAFDLWKRLDLPSFVVLSLPTFALHATVSPVESVL